jgi:hypothetical protein
LPISVDAICAVAVAWFLRVIPSSVVALGLSAVEVRAKGSE